MKRDGIDNNKINSLAEIGNLVKAPVKAPPFNYYRYAKGDLEPYEDGARVKDISVAQELIERGFIEEYHKECGITLIELRHAMLSRMDYKINSRVLTDFVGGSIAGGSIQPVLDAVTREITFSRVKIITRAMNEPAREDITLQNIAGIDVYVDCFTRLVLALRNAWKAAADEKERLGRNTVDNYPQTV